ncbi:putative ABC transporter B family member 1 [Apostichopus japonicus]|uniref:Putative ABC transporter B family member 1 n=1 Tax=Stichopus japonicus TaxID=307972 RepID=A0A2G8KRK9_STIJA|nr:putative ABC transporter B family member 1 [Apostichopus japonicus]
MVRVYYTLPFFRFCNFLRLLVFLDGCLSAALWIAGGHTKYMEDSVIDWTITGSVFELACLGLIRMVILFHLFTKLEDHSLALLQHPYDRSITSKKKTGLLITVVLSILSLIYSAVKGGLVLSCLNGSFCAMLKADSYEPMHVTYNALVISSVVFSLLELLAAVTNPIFLKRLQVMRIQHELKEDEEEGEGKEKKKKADLRRLFTLAKREKWLILLGLLSLVLSSGTTMAAPIFFGHVVDAATRKDMGLVNYYILILLAIFVGGSVAALVRSWAFTLAGTRVVCRIRRNLFKAIIKQEIAFFDETRTGELTNRLSSDTQVVQNAVTVNISMLVRYLFQILGSVVIMLTQSAALTGVLLAVVPVVAVGAVIYGWFVQNLRKKFQDALADAGTAAEEAISSIRTVRSFVGEDKAYNSYSNEIQNSYGHGKNMAIATGVFNGLIGSVSQGAIVLVLWYGGSLVTHGALSVGTLTAFMLYTLNVAMAFAFLASLYGDFMQAVGASVRIFELMDRTPKLSLDGGATPYDFTGDIVFAEVFFSYPSRPDSQVLKESHLM